MPRFRNLEVSLPLPVLLLLAFGCGVGAVTLGCGMFFKGIVSIAVASGWLWTIVWCEVFVAILVDLIGVNAKSMAVFCVAAVIELNSRNCMDDSGANNGDFRPRSRVHRQVNESSQLSNGNYSMAAVENAGRWLILCLRSNFFCFHCWALGNAIFKHCLFLVTFAALAHLWFFLLLPHEWRWERMGGETLRERLE